MSDERRLKALINIDVEDLERGLEFYVEGLGLRVGRRWTGFAELLGLECPVYLIEKEGGSTPYTGAQERRRFDRHWTPVHLDLIVEKLEAGIARATQAGANLESEIVEEPYGRIAYLSDPFGHGFCLIEFSEEGYDGMSDVLISSQSRAASSS